MITPMTRYSFILLNASRDSFLDRLQDLGVVDITRSSKAIDDESAAMLSEAEELRKAISSLSAASFPSVEPAGTADGDVLARYKELSARLDTLGGEAAAASKEAEACKAWGNFDAGNFAALEERGFKIRFYAVPAKKFSEDWKEMVPLAEISRSASTVYFVTVSDDAEYSFPVEETARPRMGADQALRHAEDLQKEIEGVKAQILGLKAGIPSLEERYSALVGKADLYFADAAGQDAVDGAVAVFEGFAPTEDDARLKEEFDKMDVLWYSEPATVSSNPPIKLSNNRFTAMFSVLTDMYGRPAYNGFDPTPYISVFFLLFFAFCMGDAGYGLILILVGLLLGKVDSFKSLSPLVVTLGVGTTVIGFFFHTFFSMDISQWEMFAPMKDFFLPAKIAGYDGAMVLALVVGVVHICLALVVKTIYATRNNGFLGSLGTWGWTLLIVGGVIVGAVSLAGVLDAATTKWVVIVLGAVSALGIFLLNDLHRNPLINIGSGLWETYNTATGLLGDVLSYLRLYALGLAGAMLGFAFNNLGQMILGDNGGLLNWIFFILIVVIGHTLNLAMCALGAFVHPLRLNFLEFFKNSAYEAAGRNYSPLEKINNNK